MLKAFLIGFTALTTSSLFMTSVMAADTKPAVKSVNGKLDIQGGSVGREGSAAVGGSVSAPIGHSFGIQVDGGLSTSPSTESGGFAGHFFYRDPDAYLLGVSSLWVRVDGRDLLRNGLESEIYIDDFTVSGALGFQNGYGRSTGYAGFDIGYYINDDLLINAGVSGYSNYRAIYAGSEWRPIKENGLSLFGNLGAGNENGGFATVGLRYNFGTDAAPLKKQHREYDPPNIVNGFTSGSGGGSGVTNQIINRLETTTSRPDPV